MEKTKTEQFWEWFEQKRAEAGLSVRAIEQVGGLSNGAISQRRREGLPPTWRVIEAVSAALRIRREEVAYRAGKLTKRVADMVAEDRELQEWVEVMQDLTYSERRQALRFAVFVRQERAEYSVGGESGDDKPTQKDGGTEQTAR